MYQTNEEATVPRGLDAFGDWFVRTFTSFAADAGVWVLQGLISFLLPFGLGLLAVLWILGGVGGLAVLQQWRVTPPTGAMLGAAMLLVFAGVVFGIFLLYLSTGMTKTALKQQRGEPISVGDLFHGDWAAVATSILLGLLFMIATLIGLVLLIIPGVLVLVLACTIWSFLLPLIIDQHLGPFAALKRAFTIIGQNFWLFFLFGLVMWLLTLIFNMLTRNWGLILTVPIGAITHAVVYCSLYDIHPGFNPQVPPVQQPYMPPAYTPPPPVKPSAPEPPDEEPQP